MPAPAPTVNDKEAAAPVDTVTTEAPFYPAARFNTAMAIQRSVLYLYVPIQLRGRVRRR